MPTKRVRKPNRPKEVIAAEKAAKAARKVERETKKVERETKKVEREEARSLKKRKTEMKKKTKNFENKFALQLLETQRMMGEVALIVAKREQAMERNLKHQAEAVEAAKQVRLQAKIAGQEAQIKADGERYEREQLTRDMEHDQSLDDIEDDETLDLGGNSAMTATRPRRMRNRVTYTPAATARAAAEAKKRGRDAGIALQKRASAKAMDKCMAAYATCMETNGWVLSDAACDNISTETVRSHMKKPCVTSEEFLTAFYEVWTEQGWSMGDPISGEDTDDAEFDNEYRTARFNQ